MRQVLVMRGEGILPRESLKNCHFWNQSSLPMGGAPAARVPSPLANLPFHLFHHYWQSPSGALEKENCDYRVPVPASHNDSLKVRPGDQIIISVTKE